MLNKLILYTKSLKIISNAFPTNVGVGKSILAYLNFKNKKNNDFKIIDFSQCTGFLKLILALFGDKNIVNSLSSFSSWSIIFFLLIKNNTKIYLHETQFTFDMFSKKNRLKYLFVKKILKTHHILCVSKQQENYLQKKFGSVKTTVVYECIEENSENLQLSDGLNILMVGTIQKRKGTSFFSELADYSKSNRRNWNFHWAGSGNSSGLYLSDNVNFLGHQSDVKGLIRKSDIFFLSSIDDPFPLSCLEAISEYKKVIVYKDTGIAEIVDGLNGCDVYQKYDVESAYNAIEKVLDEKVDRESMKKINQSISSVESFSDRIDKIMDI